MSFYRFLACLLASALFLSGAESAIAQPNPQASFSPPSELFLGEGFCAPVLLTNSGPPGYGPYFQLVLEPGLILDSASVFGGSAEIVLGPEMLPGVEDPISMTPISGTAGYAAYVIRIPVGSVVDGGPAIPVDLCFSTLSTATPYADLDIQIVPAYEFGDTPTGDNGAIVDGDAPLQATTQPIIVKLTKSNTAPESERPPGFQYEYVLNANIADQITLDNLVIADQLEAPGVPTGSLIFIGPTLDISGPASGTCAATATPTPGDLSDFEVKVTCDPATGTSAEVDIQVRFWVEVADILNDVDVDPEVSITNTALLEGEFNGTLLSNLVNDTSDLEGTTTVQVENVSIQKGASPGTVNPGDLVNYTLAIQLSDYPQADAGPPVVETVSMTAATIIDVLPDGITFAGSIDVDGTIVSCEAPTSSTACTKEINTPSDGRTTITIDLIAITGLLSGDDSGNGTPLDAGTTVSIAYTGSVDQTYEDPGLLNQPLRSRDTFNNFADIEYSLGIGGTGTDDTEAGIEIETVNINKELLTTPPFQPGDTVTYRLTLSIPSGDAQDLKFTDFFPLPVFQVASLGLPACSGTAAPASLSSVSTPVRFGPAHNLTDAFDPLNLCTDTATNSLVVDWPEVFTPTTTELLTIQIDVDIVVNGDPFADGLVLQNIVQVNTSNTELDDLEEIAPFPITLVAPLLEITKGVVATDGEGSITPAASDPPDGDLNNADAGDLVSYQVTLVNTGGAEAYDVIMDDSGVPAELVGCVVTGVSLGATALTSPDDYTGDLFTTAIELSNSLIFGGGAMDAADDEDLDGIDGNNVLNVQFDCTLASDVGPGENIDNEATSTWTSQAGFQPFPEIKDDARVTTEKPSIDKTLLSVYPGVGLAPPSPNPVQIGEILTYQVEITIPEGEISNVLLRDTLDAGLAFVELLSITPASGAGDLSWDGPATGSLSNIGGADIGIARRLEIDFGTMTNTNTDATEDEVITVTYSAQVLNWQNNDQGDRRNNSAQFRYTDPNTAGTTFVRDSAPNVTIEEPVLNLSKNISPETGEAGDTVTITLTVANNSQAHAFDVSLIDALPGTVLSTETIDTASLGVCSAAPGIGPTVTGDVLTANWVELAPGASCEIIFTAVIQLAAAAGTTIENTADLFWESLPDSIPVAGSVNPLGAERTGNPGDPGGTANDYRTEAMDDVKIPGVGITKSIISTSMASTDGTQGNGSLEDLSIGETVTFQLDITIPASTTDPVIVTDSLPFAPVVMAIPVGASDITVEAAPTDVTYGNTPPLVTIYDLQLGDGYNDTAVIDFGPVVNDTGDSVTVSITLRAVVLDILPDNIGVLAGSNVGLVEFGPGFNDSDTETIEVVEPLLRISKSGDITVGDGGDTVNFTLRVEHAMDSSASAFDVALNDPLIVGELSPSGAPVVVAANCTDIPDSGPVFSGATVEATWDEFPLGAFCEITYQAVISPALDPGQQITNVTTLDWSSVSGSDTNNDDEGLGEGRNRNTSDSWDIVISQPGVDKVITSTSVIDTEADQGGPAEDLTIGETVTYQMTVTLPDVQLLGASFQDQLNSGGVALQVVSSQIVSIGSDLTIGSGAAVTDPGINSVGDTVITWDLGDVSNTPDTPATQAEDNRIVFEVIAIVIDTGANEGAPELDNGSLNIGVLSADNLPEPISGSVPVDIVEPRLQITKTGGIPSVVAAGGTATYTLLIEHTEDSTATAYDLEIIDSLNGDASTGITMTTVNSACPGVTTSPGSGIGPVTFSLALLNLGDTCEIEYSVMVSATAAVGVALPNTADLEWVSISGGNPPGDESRAGSSSSTGTVTTPDDGYSLVKEVISTNLPDTEAGAGITSVIDATIGELVTYRLTATMAEGNSTGVVISDTLNEAGRVEFVGGRVASIGNDIVSTTLAPTTPNISGASNEIATFNFGDVSNPANAGPVENDQIVVELTVRVTNDPLNVDLATLTDTGMLTIANATPVTLNEDEIVEVVVPALDLQKSMELIEGYAHITLAAQNIGSSPSFDTVLTDQLDATWFVFGTAEAVAIPPGFILSEDGSGLVTIAVDGAPLAPSADQVISVDETVTFTFRVLLQSGLLFADLPVQNGDSVDPAARVVGSTLPGDQGDDERDGDELDGAEQEQLQDDINDDAFGELDIPLLQLTKTDNPDPAVVGTPITYTVIISNVGSGPGTEVVFKDTPPGTLLQTVTTTLGSVTLGNTAGDLQVQVNIPTIPANGSVTITFQSVIASPVPAGFISVVNQGVLESLELPDRLTDDPDLTGDSDPTPTAILAEPVLEITKTDNQESTSAGETISYVINYQNTGTQGATGIVLTETIPVGTTSGINPGWVVQGTATVCNNQAAGTICTLVVAGELAGGAPANAGSTASASFDLVVDNPLSAGVEDIANTVLITDDGTNSNNGEPVTDSATDTDTVSGEPELDVQKTDDLSETTPGSTLTYQISYSNSGNQGATGIVLTETVPVGTTSGTNAGWVVQGTATPCNNQAAATICSFAVAGELAGGAPANSGSTGSASFSVVVDNPLAADLTQISNRVDITDDGSNSADDQPKTDFDTDVDTVDADASLDIQKSDNLTETTPGATTTYALILSNAGNQVATGVFLTETVPTGTTSATNPGWVIQGTTNTCDGQAAGTVCTFAYGVLAGGGASDTVNFVIVIDNPLASGIDEISNTASITDDGNNSPNGEPQTDSSTDIDTVSGEPELEVQKTDDLTETTPGSTLTYQISYANTGNQGATGTVLTETVPVGTTSLTNTGWVVQGTATPCDNQPAETTCTLTVGSLVGGAPGNAAASGSANFIVEVDNPLAADLTQISNRVDITDDGSNSADDQPKTDFDTDVDTVDADASLDIEKSDNLTETTPGATTTYALILSNAGNQAATGVILTETVPTGATSAANPGWVVQGTTNTCDGQAAGTVCTFAYGVLAGGGANDTVNFVMVIDNPLASGIEEISNIASITDDGNNSPDGEPQTDSSTDTDTVSGEPELNVQKTDDLTVTRPGSTLTYRISYSNTGNQDATGIVLTETVPLGTSSLTNTGWVVQGTATPCDNQPAETTCTLTIGSLVGGAPGNAAASGSVEFIVEVDEGLAAEIDQISNLVIIADDGSNSPGGEPVTAQDVDFDRVARAVQVPTLPPFVLVLLILLLASMGLWAERSRSGQ